MRLRRFLISEPTRRRRYLPAAPASGGLRVGQRRSMADLLAAHPRVDDHALESQRRQLEQEARLAMQEEQMRRMRASQAQTHTHVPGLGRAQAGRPANGGFMNGIFNDGHGGRIDAAKPAGGLLNNSRRMTAGGSGNGRFHAADNVGPSTGAGPLNRVEMWRQNVKP